MAISSDYEDLFSVFNKYKVRYLLVGAYAVIYYTEPRFTKDIDIWIKPDLKNANNLYRALKTFGAPLKDISIEDFTNKRLIYQIGLPPVRVDIIMALGGLNFNSAWRGRKRSKYGTVPINILGLKELIKSKKRMARKQDLLDLDKLSAMLKKKDKGKNKRKVKTKRRRR